MMKILHVINSLNIGGAEKLLAFLVAMLNNPPEIQVDVVLLTKGEESLFHELVNNGISIKILSSKDKLRDPRNIFRLVPYFKRDYDVIHAHLFPTQYWATIAKLLSKNTQTKLVFTEHSSSNKRIRSKWLSILDKVFYKYIDQLVCITSEIEDIYVRYQPALKGKTTVIHNGIPIDRVVEAVPISRSSIDSSLKNSDKLILQVSGFKYPKDQGCVIRSLKHLPENFKIIFAGDGPLKDKCIELTDSMQLGNRVLFLGNRNDVYSLQKAVDFIVLSTHYEGLSLACVEGMASGKPFIASNVIGVQSLVGGAGVLFNESDEEDLAKKILLLDCNNSLRKSIVENQKVRASKYSISIMADEHIKLYRALLNRV